MVCGLALGESGVLQVGLDGAEFCYCEDCSDFPFQFPVGGKEIVMLGHRGGVRMNCLVCIKCFENGKCYTIGKC